MEGMKNTYTKNDLIKANIGGGGTMDKANRSLYRSHRLECLQRRANWCLEKSHGRTRKKRGASGGLGREGGGLPWKGGLGNEQQFEAGGQLRVH